MPPARPRRAVLERDPPPQQGGRRDAPRRIGAVGLSLARQRAISANPADMLRRWPAARAVTVGRGRTKRMTGTVAPSESPSSWFSVTPEDPVRNRLFSDRELESQLQLVLVAAAVQRICRQRYPYVLRENGGVATRYLLRSAS